MTDEEVGEEVRRIFSTPLKPERTMILWVNQEGMELFHKALKEEFERQFKEIKK